MKRFFSVILAAAAAGALGAGSAQAGFTSGSLVVSRMGDGTAALSSASAAVFLDQFNTTGTGQSANLTVNMPTASVVGGNNAFSNSGSASSEGALSLSTNGQYLTLAGYDAAPGMTGVVGTSAATTPRVVGRVDANGNVDTTTTITTAYNANNVRSAVTTDGTAFWTTGPTTGTAYVTYGASSTTTQLSTTITNTRVGNIFAGQLYVSSQTGAFDGISTVGAGLPTTSGQTTTKLNGFPSTTGAESAYDFVFSGSSTLYVADDETNANGGIQKWTFDGTIWTEQYVIGTGVTGIGARSLTLGTDGTLYAITAETSADRLISVVDGGSTLSSTATTLATSPTNEIFRGVDFAPTAAPEPASLGLLSLGGLFLVRRRK